MKDEKQPLTERESEVAELIRKGLRNPEIGDKLKISTHTVKQHVSNIMLKLRVNRRAHV